MQRLIELYALGDRSDARREWAKLLPNLDLSQRAAAAYLIADIGWIDLSIMAANAAELRDDLSLRFPSPFTSTFVKESRATAVPISFLYGVARQESAFGPAARSSAGALGLMQLMPATAAATARNAGEPIPLAASLFDPVVNVHIASRHLAELIERYDGNRVLVAAAYNAGSHRVDRWLRDRPARPADIWIETIPLPRHATTSRTCWRSRTSTASGSVTDEVPRRRRALIRDARNTGLIDIGANLTNPAFADDLAAVLRRAVDGGVERIIVTGTDVASSVPPSRYAQRTLRTSIVPLAFIRTMRRLRRTDGATRSKRWRPTRRFARSARRASTSNATTRRTSTQQTVFEAQLRLAVRLRFRCSYTIERAAAPSPTPCSGHRSRLRDVVVHCFTGTEAELRRYLDLDCHVGITGWICDERRGSELKRLVSLIPDVRLLIETTHRFLVPRTMSPRPKNRRATNRRISSGLPERWPTRAVEPSTKSTRSQAQMRVACSPSTDPLRHQSQHVVGIERPHELHASFRRHDRINVPYRSKSLVSSAMSTTSTVVRRSSGILRSNRSALSQR
jgi:Tat protein secretion system quality control protein TatD with DNase activity